MNQLATLLSGSCVEGQGFSQNFNPSYHQGGLLGHTGIDVNCGWGTPIASLTSGLVYSTYPINQPASDGYTAVFVITETPLETFEMSYGHVSEVDCQIGQHVKVGDVIAKEGNYGAVYVGNRLITLAEQAIGNHEGHHRHYQKRPVTKVKFTDETKRYFQTAQGLYIDPDGNYYEIYDYENGFNGCVDWSAPLFPCDLQQGMTGYDVFLLQKALAFEVGFSPYDCIGIFGQKTAAAVMALQKKHGISPTAPRVGPLTRAYLNQAYSQLV